MRGKLELHYKGSIIKQRRFETVKQHEQIIDSWKKQCGPGYYKAELKEIPDKVIERRRFTKKVEEEEPGVIPQRSHYKKGEILKYGKVTKFAKTTRFGTNFRN